MDELQAQGLPVIPSVIARSADDVARVLEQAAAWGAASLVTKPTVGASALGVRQHRTVAEARAALEQHFANTAAAGGVVVQAFQSGFDAPGEVAVVCCRGEALHAIRKKSVLTHGGHGDFDGIVELDAALVAFVERVMAAQLGGCPLASLTYLRVDVVPAASGEYVVSELEAVEPMFFLQHCAPDTAEAIAATFVDAVISFVVGEEELV